MIHLNIHPFISQKRSRIRRSGYVNPSLKIIALLHLVYSQIWKLKPSAMAKPRLERKSSNLQTYRFSALPHCFYIVNLDKSVSFSRLFFSLICKMRGTDQLISVLDIFFFSSQFSGPLRWVCLHCITGLPRPLGFWVGTASGSSQQELGRQKGGNLAPLLGYCGLAVSCP